MRCRGVAQSLLLPCLIFGLTLGLIFGLGGGPLGFGPMAASPAVARPQDNGLTVASTYSYIVDPAANVVHVVAEMAFTNTVPNTVEGDYINKAYFTGFTVPLPVEAVNVVATQNGQPIAVNPDFVDGETTFFIEKLTFAKNLFYNNTANIVLTYDILGHPPRDSAVTRINAAYVAFPAYGIADEGRLTVRVVVPAGYVIDTFGDDAVMTTEDANTVYTATDIAQPDEFTVYVSARSDAGLAVEERQVGSAAFIVKSWPDDVAWRDFVVQRLDTAVPKLEELIGEPWTVPEPITITEAVTSYLYGYAGWYNNNDRQLEIGEDLDPHVLVHELSHTWFNNNWFDARWIDEGLAQAYSDLVNQALGEAPVAPAPIDPAAPGAQPLNTWGDSSTAGDAEDFGYNASWFVIDGIIDEIGVEKMRSIFDAVDDALISYPGADDTQQFFVEGDWRLLLDLAENVGGSANARGLIEQYVVTPEQAPLLAERDAARAAYTALQAAGGAWAPPFVVRRLMSQWKFADANPRITEANAVLVQRDELQATLDDLGADIDPTIETAFEKATDDLVLVTDKIAAEQSAAEHAIGVQDATIADVHAIGVEPTAAFETAVKPEGASIEEIEANLAAVADAADGVEAAMIRDAQPRRFPDLIAAYDARAHQLLAEARAALADGNAADAEAKAALAFSIIEHEDQLDSVGVGKVPAALGAKIWLIIGPAAVVLAGLIVVLVRRRRRRERAATPTVAADTL